MWSGATKRCFVYVHVIFLRQSTFFLPFNFSIVVHFCLGVAIHSPPSKRPSFFFEWQFHLFVPIYCASFLEKIIFQMDLLSQLQDVHFAQLQNWPGSGLWGAPALGHPNCQSPNVQLWVLGHKNTPQKSDMIFGCKKNKKNCHFCNRVSGPSQQSAKLAA